LCGFRRRCNRCDFEGRLVYGRLGFERSLNRSGRSVRQSVRLGWRSFEWRPFDWGSFRGFDRNFRRWRCLGCYFLHRGRLVGLELFAAQLKEARDAFVKGALLQLS
jgi:hypothetical protein